MLKLKNILLQLGDQNTEQALKNSANYIQLFPAAHFEILHH
jgi:hypothetical protein